MCCCMLNERNVNIICRHKMLRLSLMQYCLQPVKAETVYLSKFVISCLESMSRTVPVEKSTRSCSKAPLSNRSYE